MRSVRKCLSIFLVCAMLLCSAPLAGFVGMEWPIFEEDESFSFTAEAYSGSTYTSNTEIAKKLNEVFNGSADIFSNDDNVDQNLAVGGYVNNEFKYKYGSYSGWQCYAYANAVYNYLFGEVPFHGDRNYAYSKVVLKNTSKPSYETLMNAGVACGAYVRITKTANFSDWGSYGHSYIILSYDTNGITILDANSNDGAYYGKILIQTLSWDVFYTKIHYYNITHIVQPNVTYGTNCTHKYDPYVCSECGAFDKDSIYYRPVEKYLKVIDGNAIDHTGPYGKCKKVNEYSTGTVLVATELMYNAYDHIWYKLSDGTYIWSDYVEEYTIKYTDIPEGTYYMKNVASGDYMTVAQSLDVNGQDVVTWEKTGETGMQMIITKAKDGYKIRPACSDTKILNADGSTVEIGDNVNIYDDCNETSQMWKFEKVGKNYIIHSTYNTTCVLAAPGGSRSSVTMQTYAVTKDQKWKLEAVTECTSHSYTGRVTTPATCTTGGVITHTCTLCGAQKTEAIDKLSDHSYSIIAITKAATCQAEGVRTYTCEFCSATKTEAIPKTTAHNYANSTVTLAPTCIAAGEKTLTCRDCGAQKTETVPMLPHTYDDGVVTKLPTSESSGTMTYTCMNGCGFADTISITVDDLLAYGTCGDNLNWGLTHTGSLVIVGEGEMNSNPWNSYRERISKIFMQDGITTIGSYAFSGCTNLNSVQLSASLTSIGSNAFYNCTSLSSIQLPASLVEIGSQAFYNCDALSAINIPKALTDVSAPYDPPFAGCDNLKSITFESGITSIPGRLFANCPGLENVVIPDTVTTIGRYAFSGCTNLNSVQLPASLVEIGSQAFYNCDALSAINIPKALTDVSAPYDPPFAECDNLKNVTFENGITSIPGRLFANCPGLENVVIPDTVTTIGGSAFYGCTNLNSVQLSANLTCIEGSAFRDCTSLADIVLPATVTTIDDYAFYNCDALTEINIPKTLSYVGYNGIFGNCDNLKSATIENGITTIPADLFEGCPGIESIVIPDTVTTIGGSAFYGCTNLKSVQLPENLTSIGNYAFRDCTSLTDLVIPSTVTSIGSYAFYDCDGLTSINIHKALTSIGDYGIFNSCDNLKTVTFESGITAISAYLFRGCTGLESIVIPDTVTSIGSYAFTGCSNMKSVQLPENLTSIGGHAFYGCTNLKSVQLPKNLTSIGGHAFYGCTNLKSVQLPENLTSIGNYAFRDCTSLTDLVIPSTVTSIGSYAFYDCDGLTSINIHKALTNIGDYGIFNSCDNLKTVTFESGITAISAYLFRDCTGLESIVIPDTVTSIGSYAFTGCSNMKSVQLPENLTSIGGHAFYGCTNLKSVQLPENLTSIGGHAFYGCSSLVSATLPSQITSLPNSLFSGCSSLTTIAIPKTVKTIGDSAFYNCKALESFTFPDGSSVETISSSAFYGCEALTAVSIPAGVKTVSSYAFQNCAELHTVVIPQSVKTVSSTAFRGCEKLANVTLADYSVTTLEDSVFMDIPALQEIVLPKGLTTISNQAFRNCTGLVKITIPASVTSIATNALSYPDKTVICGVKGSYAETFAKENGFTFEDITVAAQGFALKDGVEQINMDIGDKHIAEFEWFPSDATDCVAMTTSNNKVQVTGMELYARYSGDCVVTATTTSGLTYDINVHIRAPRNIQVTQNPTKMTYLIGEEFDPAGMVVSVLYDDNTTETVTDYTVSGFDSSKEGTNRITLKWVSKTGSSYTKALDLTIIDTRPKLTGIVIDTLPAKTNYNRTEALDLTGMVVLATYSDDSSSVITDYTVSGYNALKYGVQTITVTYGDFKATFEVTVVKPHTCTEGEWEISTPAICTAAGEQIKKCTECGKVMAREDILALGHTEEVIPAVAATCTTTGLTEGKKCSVCGEILEEQAEVSALGHTEEVIPAVAPTCTEMGLTEGKKCSVCGEILEEQAELPALGHTEEIIPAVAATCTTTGLTEGKKCSVCGEILEEQAELSALGHTWDAGVVTTAPTVDAEGVKTFTCLVCGETKTESVDKLVPSFTDSETIILTNENIVSVAGATAAQLLSQAGDGAAVADKNGNALAADAKIGTGAVLTLADGTQHVVVVQGDADGDGAITSSDARSLLRYSVGLDAADAAQKLAADVDSDGRVSSSDARLALRASVGLEKPADWLTKIK